MEDDFEQINSAAVKLAREAREISGRDVFIGGSIGPLGEPATTRVRHALFAEQASVLEGRGADLFMVETFYDLEELVDAIEASPQRLEPADRRADDVRRGGGDARRRARARGGRAAARARRRRDRRESRQRAPDRTRGARADGERPAARGAPEHRPREPVGRTRHLPARRSRVLRGVRRPCAKPRREGDRRLLRDDADRDRGDPRCGRAAPRATRAARVLASGSSSRRSAEEQRETGFARALREGEFVFSVQLDPPLGGSALGLLEVAHELRDGGIDFVDVNDNATARAGMSSLFVSARIERETGLETVPHLTTRDWTVLGLESILLGAHAEGVRNILAITGDPPEVGDYPGARGRLRGRRDRADQARDHGSTAARTSTAARSTRRRRSTSASPSIRRQTTSKRRRRASAPRSRPGRATR